MSAARDAWRLNLKPMAPLHSPAELHVSPCRELLYFKTANSTMDPRYRRDEALAARPGIRPINGDDVVSKLKGEAARYAVLRLVRRTRDSIVCCQYKPAREIIIPKIAIERIYCVLTTNEMTGAPRSSQIRHRLRRGVATGLAWLDRNKAQYAIWRRNALAEQPR
jgi:hypothetical protein